MFERFTTEARVAVIGAQEFARESTASRIEPQHVFLGVLDAADDSLKALLADEGYTVDTVKAEISKKNALGDADAQALETIGIDLSAVRASLDASFGEGALDRSTADKRSWFGKKTGHIAFAPASKKALELSLREAIARKDSEIRCQHLLLGLIRGADDGFTALVVNPDHLRARIIEALSDAA
ncbi:Clp protease N-terminal domain-containing protein [Rhodococcoides yunnanense]|uniref:Clp protease N-terminal domain-containing protein n=1 Tax=Rhodococcoides yunnanense TaxID=278209 RepID=UPI0009356584|nr:Clp protease N-terminal domain-containing protein [Rhodococcus yunnanensis]